MEDAVVDDALLSDSFSSSETSVLELPLAEREQIICSLTTSLFKQSNNNLSQKKIMVLTAQVRKGQNVQDVEQNSESNNGSYGKPKASFSSKKSFRFKKGLAYCWRINRSVGVWLK